MQQVLERLDAVSADAAKEASATREEVPCSSKKNCLLLSETSTLNPTLSLPPCPNSDLEVLPSAMSRSCFRQAKSLIRVCLSACIFLRRVWLWARAVIESERAAPCRGTPAVAAPSVCETRAAAAANHHHQQQQQPEQQFQH